MVELKNIYMNFEDTRVLKDFSLSVAKGDHVAIMGPSGSGKTTILKLISRQLIPTEGNVIVNADKISYMFQEPRLLPWLTAIQNVNLVLGDKEATLPTAQHWLEAVGLKDAEHKYPSELSGGMKQRVALARALAFNGDLLLLDEPLSAIDEDTAEQLLEMIKENAKSKTVIFVTHNSSYAKKFADTIYVIKSKNT